MITFKKKSIIGTVLLAGFFTWTLAGVAFSEEATAENAKALLDTVKQRELDRQVSVKKTDMERLKEDLNKGKTDADGLQKNIDTTGNYISESSANLDKLVSQRKHLEQVLNLTELRIEAERRKTEGLRLLIEAQSKSLAALMNRVEEIDARSKVREAEVKLLTEGKPVPDDDHADKDFLKLRKALATCELRTASQERAAREAMKIASSKLQVADAADARVKRMSEGVSPAAPDPVAEKLSGEKETAIPKAIAVPKAAAPKPTASPKPTAAQNR